MTKESESNDKDWIDALDGKPNSTADPDTNLLALSLRKAIKERSTRQEIDMPRVDSEFYEQMMTRLRREGLLETKNGQVSDKKIKGNWLDKMFSGSGFSLVLNRRIARFVVIGALITVAIVLMNHQPIVQDSESTTDLFTYRNSEIQSLIVENPEEEGKKIEDGVKQAGGATKSTVVSPNRIEIQIFLNDQVLSFLATKQIEPPVKAKDFILVITTD